MVRLKKTIMLVVCLSFAFAGFPALAMPQQCPMEKMQQATMKAVTAKTTHCEKCPEMAQKKQTQKKKGGCCDDASCNIKCMNGLTIAFHAPDYKLPSLPTASQVFVMTNNVLTSHLGNAQDRPPKNLS